MIWHVISHVCVQSTKSPKLSSVSADRASSTATSVVTTIHLHRVSIIYAGVALGPLQVRSRYDVKDNQLVILHV